MKICYLVVIGAIILAGGCSRYSDYLADDKQDVWTPARVVNMGAPEADGCGWMIRIGDEYFYPVNLEDEYRVENLPVIILYTYDPVEFRCGRGGIRYQSIRISVIEIDAPAVKNLPEEDWDQVPEDGFKMDSAFVSGDFLHLRVTYGGGCKDHDFTLWELPPNALDPPPVELMLSHDAKSDGCYALVTEWLLFSLKPLRERNKHEVKFLLRGSPEMSAYFGTYFYKY